MKIGSAYDDDAPRIIIYDRARAETGTDALVVKWRSTAD